MLPNNNYRADQAADRLRAEAHYRKGQRKLYGRRRRYAHIIIIDPAIAVFLSLAILIIILNVIFWPRASDARAVARNDGLTNISKTEYEFLSFCHKDYVAYRVTGLRNGQPATITVCATPFSWFSYTQG